MPQFRNADEVRDRQTEIRDAVEALNQEYEGRVFEAEDRDKWNSLNEEFVTNERLIVELEAREQQVAALAGNPDAVEHSPGTRAFNTSRKPSDKEIYDLVNIRQKSRSLQEESQFLVDHAMRAVETTAFPHPQVDDDFCRGHVERMLKRFRDADDDDFDSAVLARRILTTGSPDYKRAFSKALYGKPLTTDESRALGIGGSSGGFAVPFSLDPTIIPTSNWSVNPFRAIASVEQITGTTWQGVSSAGVTATYTAEGVEAADATPALLQPTATPTKCQVTIPYSIEVGGDWPALQAEMAQLISDAKDDVESVKFTLGNGTNEPSGVLTGATLVVTTAASGAFALADFATIEGALPPRFRPRAQWVANRAFYNLARFLDTSGGSGLWLQMAPLGVGLDNQPNGNINARLLGYPANEDSAMTAGVNVNNALIAVLGDFRYFKIVDRIGMNVEVIPHLFGTTARLPIGVRAIYAYWRNTSVVVSANAFRVVKMK
jgi:HK97 family phage major capsid protein